MSKPCPCGSTLEYSACCRPFHRAEREPETPAALVRARFSAFALGEADFLWRTLHPDHDDRERPRDEVLRELREASRTHRYLRLEILRSEDTRVLFSVKVFAKGKDLSFQELSTFARAEGGWRYLVGEPHALPKTPD
jgi:SEC-C motif-containing protein